MSSSSSSSASASASALKRRRLATPDTPPYLTISDGPHLLHLQPPSAPPLHLPTSPPSSPSPSPASPSSDLLATLVHPLRATDFLTHVHNQGRAYAVTLASPSGDASRFASLVRDFLFDLDVRELTQATPSDAVFVWLRRVAPLVQAAASAAASSSSSAAGIPPKASETPLHSIPMDDPDSAYKCFEAGASLYFRAPDELSAVLVPLVLDALGCGFAGRFGDGAHAQDLRGEIETFVSRQGHRTPWHCDFMDNITLQLSGQKTWRFKSASPVMRDPVRGATPHFAAVDTHEQQMKLHRLRDPNFTLDPGDSYFDDAQAVTLGPGSVLYHPAGIWHTVEADSDSVAINVSLFPLSMVDMVCNGMRQAMLRRLDTHKIFRVPQDDSEQGARVLRDRLAQVLHTAQAALADLTPEHLAPEALLSVPSGDEPMDLCDILEANEDADDSDPQQLTTNELMVIYSPPGDHDHDHDDDDDDCDSDQHHHRWLLNLNFGQAEYESLWRKELTVPEGLHHFMTLLEKHTPGQPLSADVQWPPHFLTVLRGLGVLVSIKTE